jgi:hypothetical protein
MNLVTAFQAVQLLLAVFHEVHAIQAALPGAPGADKSQAVIDKVTPIAETIGAHAEALQGIINGVVGLAKAVGTIKRDVPAVAVVAVDSPGAGAQVAP